MAATSARLRNSQVKPSCESRLASARPGAHWGQLFLVWEDLEVMKPKLRPAIHMEKRVGWAHKLSGKESQGISRAGHTVLARLMECQIWHQLACSVGEGSEKGQWPPFALLPNTSVSPTMSLVSFKQLPGAGAQRDWVWVGESVCGFFKKNCLGLQRFLPLTNPCWFLQTEVLGTYLPGIGKLGWGVWCGAGTLLFWDIPPKCLSTTCGCGTSLFHVSTLPANLDGFGFHFFFSP